MATAMATATAIATWSGAAQPGATPAAKVGNRERILYLSATSPAQDEPDVALLRATLKGAGFGAEARFVVQRRQVSFDLDAQMREVRSAFDEGPVRLVVATSLNIARSAQLLNDKVPIVFAGAGDPVLGCLAETLQRPGRNATGITTALRAEAKMLEALHDAYPSLDQWVILVGPEEEDATGCDEDRARRSAAPPHAPACAAGEVRRPMRLQREIDVAAVHAIAHRLGQPVTFYRVCALQDIDAFAAASSARRGRTGVVVPLYLLFYRQGQALTERLKQAGLASAYDRRDFVNAGGLMAVVPRVDPSPMATTFEIAIQVLQGADPANVPVHVPSGFDLWLNLRTARELATPPSLRALARADHFVD